MARALVMVRQEVQYRHDAVWEGVKAAGLKPTGKSFSNPGHDDLIVTWNRYGASDSEARRFAKTGAAVIVMENGIVGANEDAYRKQYDQAGNQLYCLALNFHNGCGRWWIGASGRWREQGIKVEPWRADGEEIIILPQRGIGPPEIAMPRDWPNKTWLALRGMTNRTVRIRAHPGNEPARKALAEDLAKAWAVVTWGSSAAVKAICAGIPAFYGLKGWVGCPAARLLTPNSGLEGALRDDECRETMLDRLAWMQWPVPDIAAGEPFRRLLALHQEARKAA